MWIDLHSFWFLCSNTHRLEPHVLFPEDLGRNFPNKYSYFPPSNQFFFSLCHKNPGFVPHCWSENKCDLAPYFWPYSSFHYNPPCSYPYSPDQLTDFMTLIFTQLFPGACVTPVWAPKPQNGSGTLYHVQVGRQLWAHFDCLWTAFCGTPWSPQCSGPLRVGRGQLMTKPAWVGSGDPTPIWTREMAFLCFIDWASI